MLRSQDDILKLKAALLYVLEKAGSLDMLHIFKILYFADRDHLAKYGRRIINDDFHALKNGPVPTKLYDIIKHIQGKGSLSKNECERFHTIIEALEPGEEDAYYMIHSSEKCDLDELSTSDIDCLDRSFDENNNLVFGNLSQKSHDDAYNKAWGNKSDKHIKEDDIARSGGASNDTIEYIKDMRMVANALS